MSEQSYSCPIFQACTSSNNKVSHTVYPFPPQLLSILQPCSRYLPGSAHHLDLHPSTMPIKQPSECQACGADPATFACATCADRLKNKGTAQGICTACAKDADVIITFGKLISVTGTDAFTCKPCLLYLERIQQEAILQKLQGPTPETILRTVATKFQWFLVVSKASIEERLDALQYLKRKLSGQRTFQTLATSMASTDPAAALLIQQLGLPNAGGSAEGAASSINPVLKSFVKNQCPVVQYKSLLLPPSGSIYKATQHFRDMLKVEDPLVVAMAHERLFLCEFFEAKYKPTLSEKTGRSRTYRRCLSRLLNSSV